jgi:signal transduction histidine kinase
MRSKCQNMSRLIERAVDNVGRIITDLRPSILDHQGLWAALEWQAQEFVQSPSWRWTGRLDVDRARPSCPSLPAMAVFRIFQEMLSNVGAMPAPAMWRAHCRSDDPPRPVLAMEVRDDGVARRRGALSRHGLRRDGHARARPPLWRPHDIDSQIGQGRVRLVPLIAHAATT